MKISWGHGLEAFIHRFAQSNYGKATEKSPNIIITYESRHDIFAIKYFIRYNVFCIRVD